MEQHSVAAGLFGEIADLPQSWLKEPSSDGGLSAGLGPTPEALAIADLLAAYFGRDHRVIDRKVPLGSVFVGRHAVSDHQRALERLDFIPVLKGDNAVGREADEVSERNAGILEDCARL